MNSAGHRVSGEGSCSCDAMRCDGEHDGGTSNNGMAIIPPTPFYIRRLSG